LWDQFKIWINTIKLFEISPFDRYDDILAIFNFSAVREFCQKIIRIGSESIIDNIDIVVVTLEGAIGQVKIR